MNWALFTLLLWLAVGFDVGFRDALQLGHLAIAPSCTFVLLTYVCVWASRGSMIVCAIIAGLLIDLTSPVVISGGQTIALVGPNALGCMLGAALVMNLRAVMFRKNVLTLGVLAMLLALVSSVVVVSLLTLRARYDTVVFVNPSRELGGRALSAVLTGVLGIVLAIPLAWLRPAFGFRKLAAAYPRMRH